MATICVHSRWLITIRFGKEYWFSLKYLNEEIPQISPVVSYVPTPVYPTQYYYAGLPELPLYEDG